MAEDAGGTAQEGGLIGRLLCFIGAHDYTWVVGPISDPGLPEVEEERCERCGFVRESHGELTYEEWRSKTPEEPASEKETDFEDLPGGYDSVEGIKERASALGNPILPKYIDRAEDRIVEREDGFYIETPDGDYDDAEMLFHIGILTGAAFEREYPAPGQSSDSAQSWSED